MAPHRSIFSDLNNSIDKEVASDGTSIEPVLNTIASYYPQGDLGLVVKAFEFATEAHKEQKRASGEPYVVHPVGVADILSGLRVDCTTIAAGLLHDVIEDADLSLKTLRHEFGEEVASLVEGVTKVSRLFTGSTYEEDQLETFRRLIVATAKDQRTVLIKLADRLHNMRTLKYLNLDKRRRISISTQDIYAPLAHRMGIGRIKDELEDLALKYLHPEIYRELREKLMLKAPEREAIVDYASEILIEALQKDGLQAEISKRVKHYASIYRKMLASQRGFEDIYDLLAMRVITDTDANCYAILGKVHHLWRPLHERFKDYISVPKSNDYRSLHTTVVGPRGRLMEVQIRTHEMNNVAENGIAAHWRYKRDADDTDSKLGDDVRWLNQFSQDLVETANPEEFMEALKVDLFAEQIVVYTPDSDLIQLPRGASVVDFAYKIHSEIGDHCMAGKVNGKFVPLSYTLQTGDRIEVLTKKDAHPSREWLSFAKTARARNKIRRVLMQLERGKLLESGRALLKRELERAGISAKTLDMPEKMAKVYEGLKVKDLEDLCVSVGFGKVLTKHVISRLLPKTQQSHKKQEKEEGVEKIQVKDIDGYAYRRAQCCRPLPGDPIVGFVTKNRGISIHAADCQSIRSANVAEERLLPLYWDRQETDTYQVEIGVEARDRERLLSDVTSMISATGTNISGSLARSYMDGSAKLVFSVQVVDVDHLNRVINRIIPITGVKAVLRRTKAPKGLGEPSSSSPKKKKPPKKQARKNSKDVQP